MFDEIEMSLELAISLAALATSIVAIVLSFRARMQESKKAYASKCAALQAQQWDVSSRLRQALIKLDFVPEEDAAELRPELDELYRKLDEIARHLTHLLLQPATSAKEAIKLEQLSATLKPLTSEIAVIENGIAELVENDQAEDDEETR